MTALAAADAARHGALPTEMSRTVLSIADLQEPTDFGEHPDTVDMTVPRVISADELQVDEDSIVIERRADTAIQPHVVNDITDTATSVTPLPTVVEEIEEDVDINSAIHPTRLDEYIPILVAIDDSDDSDDDEERPVIPTATPPTPPRSIKYSS